MKIGVYGCSFASCTLDQSHLAWFNILAKKLNGSVFNFETMQRNMPYGIPAASIFYSYKQFLKYHKEHDLNIFVVTDPYKYPKQVDILTNGQLVFLPGINNCNEYTNNPYITKQGKQTVQNIKGWYIASDDEFMMTSAELMIEDMLNKGVGKTLLISTFLQRDYSPNMLNKLCFDWGMWDLHSVQCKSLGIKPNEKSEIQTQIASHFTKETNTVLATMLFNYITKGEKSQLPSKIVHEGKWNNYYQ